MESLNGMMEPLMTKRIEGEKKSKNPIFKIGEFRGGRQVGEKNIDKVLLWVYQWGWSYESVLMQLLGVKRRVGVEFCRREVLLKVEPPRGHPPAYIISPAYLTRALQLYEKDAQLSIPYPFHRSPVPFATLGEHQEIAQQIALNECARHGGYLRVDRELRDGDEGALPDFLHRYNNYSIWHEIELTPKYQLKLFKQLAEREIARKERKFNQMVWWCRTEGIKRNLQECLARESIPQITRGDDYKLQRITGQLGWNPSTLAACSVFHIICGSDPELKLKTEQERLQASRKIPEDF